jgi:hypothetical protein
VTYEVRVGDTLADDITGTFGPKRSGEGAPSEWDFWSGPLAAALVGFRDFDALRHAGHARVRTLHVVDPVFGPVVFVGVLVAPGVVELAAFAHDPDYWSLIEDDPDD